MESGLLSIIVPTFDREALISATVCSLLEQDYRPVELIVVDDGSRDATAAVVHQTVRDYEAPDVRLKLIVLPRNHGAAHARNVGLEAAIGEYVFFNDSDDLIDRRKLALQIEALKADEALDFVYGPTRIMETGVAVFGARYLDGLDVCIRQLRSPFFSTPGPVFRRRFLDRAGNWDAELPCCEDWEFHLRLSYHRPRYHWTPKAVAYYRSRGQGGEGRLSAGAEAGRKRLAERQIVGHYGRIVSAIENAPDWALESAHFRLALRWNAWRVAVLCLKAGSGERADRILAKLRSRNLPGSAIEKGMERLGEVASRFNRRLFQYAVAGSDFIYFRFYGLAGRLRRAVGGLG